MGPEVCSSVSSTGIVQYRYRYYTRNELLVIQCSRGYRYGTVLYIQHRSSTHRFAYVRYLRTYQVHTGTCTAQVNTVLRSVQYTCTVQYITAPLRADIGMYEQYTGTGTGTYCTVSY